MNCCLWIILLLACRGNCGFGCRNVCYDSCDVCERNDCVMDRCGDFDCMECAYNDCGCENNRRDYETYDCNDNRRGYETNDCNDNRVGYETYGCQENGIPCPPPVPGNCMR